MSISAESVAINSLIQSNVSALDEGEQLLSTLQQNHYTHSGEPAFKSTIGAHFRHVLEHYRCIVRQLKDTEFCYDSRERDQLLECDLNYAVSVLQELRNDISAIDESEFAKKYTIRDQQITSDDQSLVAVSTTLQRELLFLQSHTVHHFAMIGAMVRLLGLQTDDDFGVALATRVHEQEHAANNLMGSVTSCAR